MIGQITIGGVQYPLRYGMSITREAMKLNMEEIEPEDFSSFLIYQAHKCWAKSRQELPTLDYATVVDFVEGAICSNNAEDLKQIETVITDYGNSSFTKDLIKVGQKIKEEEEKKSLNSPITSDSLTVNSD